MPNADQVSAEDVWFVYDGQCPLCMMGATHFKVREAIGALHLLDARKQPDHPLMQEINRLGLNLDEGMVIKFKNTCYQGADALHIMAMLGTDSGWFNRINACMFRSKTLSALFYPAFRSARNLLLKLRSVEKINNLRGQP
ncbi:MAG: DCC1-like thiol-disulfide oxidoreductase family protein [Rickettsiales bacterium]